MIFLTNCSQIFEMLKFTKTLFQKTYLLVASFHEPPLLPGPYLHLKFLDTTNFVPFVMFKYVYIVK